MSESSLQGINPNRLLLIDDSKGITDILEEISSDAGYDVRSVNQYEFIIQEIELHVPTVIFLDLHLGPADHLESDEEIPREGMEILKYLSTSRSKAKIVIVSGLSRRTRELNQYLGRDLDLHVVGSISKPFNIKNVQEILEKLRVQTGPGSEQVFI